MLDVMLIDVAARAVDEASVTAIPLLATQISDDWLGKRITLAGVGETESGEDGVLRFVEELIVDVTTTELWVDGMGKSGACRGDSGGPLLVQDSAGEVHEAGVLDRGSRDCLGSDVYFRADVTPNGSQRFVGTPVQPAHNAQVNPANAGMPRSSLARLMSYSLL